MENKVENFVNLHVGTEYSEINICRINDLIEKAKKYNMTSLAKTDFGTWFLNGVDKFYSDCITNKIKPIIGLRSALINDEEKIFVCLYAKNNKGYKDLRTLISKSRRPNANDLKDISGNLVCSIIAFGKSSKTINTLKDIFGEDLYIELTGDGEYFSKSKELAKEFNIKTVIVDTVCFVNKNDIDEYRKNKKRIEDKNGYMSTEDNDDEEDMYFKSFEEIAKKYPNDSDSILRTNEIADKCNLIF